MGRTGEARTDPTPIATPTKLVDGILEAEYTGIIGEEEVLDQGLLEQ